MKRGTVLAAVVVSLAAALQLTSEAAGQTRLQEDDPVELLLNMRRQLNLSWHQVSALREIQQRLDAANQPLVRRLVEIQKEVQAGYVHADGGLRERELRPSEDQLARARDPLRKIQQNNMAAMEQVNALLTAEQKRIARSLLQVQQRRHEDRPWWIRLPGG